MPEGFYIHGMNFDADRMRRWVAFVKSELQPGERAEFVAALVDPDGHPLSDKLAKRLKDLTMTFILQDKQGP